MLHDELMYNKLVLETEIDSTQGNHNSKKYGCLFTLAKSKAKQCSHIPTSLVPRLPQFFNVVLLKN